MTSWRTRLASSVLLVVLMSGAVRAAYWLLAPAVPWLIVMAASAVIYLFMWRPNR
jgi:hypothetical protein